MNRIINRVWIKYYFPESARFTAEDVERLKKLVEEKAELRREGFLKQRRPVTKIDLEIVGEEAGIEPETEGERNPGLKLEIKQELEKQESGLKPEMEQESMIGIPRRDEK